VVRRPALGVARQDWNGAVLAQPVAWTMVGRTAQTVSDPKVTRPDRVSW